MRLWGKYASNIDGRARLPSFVILLGLVGRPCDVGSQQGYSLRSAQGRDDKGIGS